MASYTHKLMMQAVAHHQKGELPLAEPIYRQVLAQEPNNPEALHLLGVLLHQTGKSAEGLDLIQKAIRLRPNSPEYHVNAAEILRATGRREESLATFERAARLNPNIPELHNNLATLQLALNQPDAAEASLNRALALRPNFPHAFVNMGNVMDRRGKRADAIHWYHRALSADPNHAEALASLGNVLCKEGKIDEALAVLQRSIQINPRISKAHNNLANALQSRGLLEESIAAYRNALSLDPQNAVSFSNLLFALNRDPRPTPEEVFSAHREYARRYETPLLPPAPPQPRAPASPLRIGYVSPDLRRHSVAYFLEPILAHHDKSKFHVTCYSNTELSDSVTTRLQSLSDAWRDITTLSDAEAADAVRRDRIDILIDLAGHTEGGRLMLFARKPAPTQITYLGYPNTTGLTAIDFRLTDPLADPPGQTDPYHSEKLLRLPETAWCFRPPADAPPVPPRPASSPLTFGSFNNFAKLTPQWIAVWAQLLHQTPGARLLLKTRSLDDPGTRAHCAALFARHGITPDRLTLLPWDPIATSHLATYHQVDVALDTYPYHGTTTTCEALYMGVPVVTLAGKTHVSRVGVSLLTNAGLPHLIATSPEQYVSIAAALAADRQKLAAMREDLRAKLSASPICDEPSFVRDFEAALVRAVGGSISSPA